MPIPEARAAALDALAAEAANWPCLHARPASRVSKAEIDTCPGRVIWSGCGRESCRWNGSPGKRTPIGCVYLDPVSRQQLRILGIEAHESTRTLMTEAVNALLQRQGKPPIA